MTNIVYLNGAFMPIEEARISPLDRGFLFGDGIYDVIKCRNGKIFMFPEHKERIQNSMTGLKFPPVDISNLEVNCKDLLTKNDLLSGDALVYLQITRGAYAMRTHEFPSDGFNPTFYMTAGSCPILAREGLKLMTQPDHRWQLCKYKTVNLLGNVLAKQAVVEEGGCDEVVLVRDGVALECSSSALAIIKDGEVISHPEEDYILPSISIITMRRICEAKGIPTAERPFSVDEVKKADEVLVLSTVRDISQATLLDGEQVGNKDSSCLEILQQGFAAMLEEQCGSVENT